MLVIFLYLQGFNCYYCFQISKFFIIFEQLFSAFNYESVSIFYGLSILRLIAYYLFLIQIAGSIIWLLKLIKLEHFFVAIKLILLIFYIISYFFSGSFRNSYFSIFSNFRFIFNLK